jgi:hypothetical protein
MSKSETEKGRLKMASFLKEAFCIDGEAAFKKNVKLDGLFGETYELSDSKRGVFYISIHSEKSTL